jgi:AcrR family transcriptional regulator
MRQRARKSYHHGDLHNALLKAALALVRDRRSTHFTLRDVSERVGVTQSAIYRHFADLDDLLSTLCRNGFDAFAEAQRQAMASNSDPWQRLRALVRAHLHFAISNPDYFRIMFDSGGLANRPENIARGRPTFQLLVDTIAEIDGTAEHAFERAVAIWAAGHGLAALMLSGQLGGILNRPDRAARLEETVMALIEQGLAGLNREASAKPKEKRRSRPMTRNSGRRSPMRRSFEK